MKIWKESGFVDGDPWVVETEDQKAGEGQKPLLDLEAFIEAADQRPNETLGVLIRPADDVTKLEPYLYRIEIVAVAFPSFSDGRAFSHATLLRQRLGYTNEIRAVGDVLIDQIPLMLRVGIDSFAVTNEVALKRLAANALPGIPHHYQPAAASNEAVAGYSWRRLPTPAA